MQKAARIACPDLRSTNVIMHSKASAHEHRAEPRARSDHISFAAFWLLFLTNFGPFPRSRCVLQSTRRSYQQRKPITNKLRVELMTTSIAQRTTHVLDWSPTSGFGCARRGATLSSLRLQLESLLLLGLRLTEIPSCSARV